MKTQSLILDQVDEKIRQIRKIEEIGAPPEGWIHAVRKALGMSLQQLGKRMNMTAQGAKEMEIREKNGTITLKSLQQAASSLDMKLFYGFIPRSVSLEKMIETRAMEIATEIVRRTATSMILEDQGNTEERIKKAILEKALEIKREMPRFLWD